MSWTLKLPFFVVVTSPTSTRPFPRNEITSPLSTAVFGLHPSRQFTFTEPLPIKSLFLDRLMRNPVCFTCTRG